MSEYQYYEFQAIDRTLTEEERTEIGSWSSRTTPSSTQAIFTYSYGQFPKSAKKVVEKFFDAMLYLSNWGTKQLIFRLPRTIVDGKLLTPYCFSDMVSISVIEGYAILDICFSDEEGGGWIEGEGWLSSLIPLRNDILNGDYRMLYLAWLHAINLAYDVDNCVDELEPPVPHNLQSITASLRSFIDLFEIDNDLVAAAVEASVTTYKESTLDIETEIAKLSVEERTNFLVRLAKGERHIDRLLLKRLRELSPGKMQTDQNPIKRRNIAELLKSAHKISERRKEQERQQAEQERIYKLTELAKQETELWGKITILIEQKKPKAYDEAVEILEDLRDLSKYLNQVDQFQLKIDHIHENYSMLPGLRSRLYRAGLTRART